MTSSPIGGSIHVSAAAESALHPGQVVAVRVIKQLDAGKWAVGIRGRVYPASSELLLEPGSVLRVRVGGSPGRLVLTVSAVEPDAVLAALSSEGLPTGGVEEIVARALARAGLPLVPETVHKIRALLARAGMDERKAARSAVSLVDKRIDPSSPGAAALLRVLGFGQKGGEDPRRYRGRQLPETPRSVREYVATLADRSLQRPSILQAYNHRAGRSQTWVVIPFAFGSEPTRVEGTVKILYDVFRERPLALSVATEGVGLYLPLQGSRPALSVYCDSLPLRRAAEQGLDSLRSKFHNMGLEVDDIIKEGSAFDGFSPVEEGETFPSVDTVS